MPELEDNSVAVELAGIYQDIEHLEARLSALRERREKLVADLNRQLTAIGARSTRTDAGLVVVSREPRWVANPVSDGVEWAVKRGHAQVLTLKDREFSRLVDELVAKHGKGVLPPWVKRFDVLKLSVRK